MQTCWQRLIRFISTDSLTLYGEPILPFPSFDLGTTTASTGLQARVIIGNDLYDETGATYVSDEVVTVQELLGPLTPETVPVVRCIGLTNMAHVLETGKPKPSYPAMFMKASPAVHDHGKDIVIPKIAQDEQADYEGELVIVIGRTAKDVSPASALSYIAGYTIGNDVSSRKLQSDPALAGPMPQAGFSKGFDTFAPMGPCLVSTHLIPDPEKLTLETRVDGELRQRGEVADLAFGVGFLVSYYSQGTSLQRGSVIMTGTPGGVGCHMKPPRFLEPGNQVEISVPGIGTLRNGVRYA